MSIRITRKLASQKVAKRSFLTVVNQAEIAYRSFLGSDRVRLEPGLRLSLPIFHKTSRVDMRERGSDLDEIRCYSKDNVPVLVSGTLFHRVLDADLALFEVQDYVSSVLDVGQSSVRAVIGRFDYDAAIKNRSEINDELRTVVADSVKAWGVECSRFEMKAYEPQNAHVAKSLEKQMEAERNRRENELSTQVVIRTAEGARDAEKLKADAKYYQAQKVSDAQRYEIEQATQAAINQIKEVKAAVPSLSEERVLAYLLERQRLQHLQSVAASPNSKTYFIDPSSAFPGVNTVLAESKQA